MKLNSFRRSASPLAACIAGLALTAISANAAITISSTAPTVDGDDQGKVGAADSQNFGKSFNSGASDVGQTFTTSSSTGIAMDSVSFKLNAAQTGVGVTTPATISLRLIQITGGDGTAAGTYTTEYTSATQSFTGSFLANDWFTLKLPETVALAANTLYGVDLRVVSGGTGITFGTSMKAGSGGYTNGRFYDPGWGISPTASGALALNSSEDMMFHVNIIPEPSAALLGGLGMLALLRRRR